MTEKSFPNAREGAKQILMSQLILIIGVGIMFIGTILMSLSAVFEFQNAEGVFQASLLLILSAMILEITAYVFCFLGMHKAGKDSRIIRCAYGLAVPSVAMSIAEGLIPLFVKDTEISTLIPALCSSVGRILGMIIMIFVLLGLSQLYKEKENEERASKGLHVAMFLTAAHLPLFVLNGLAGASSSAGVMIAEAVTAAIALPLYIAAVIRYLLYLNKARFDL